MKIKSNDQVKIIAGKDKGKIGKVLQVFPVDGRASVEGLNLLVKHLRPQKKGDKGQRVEFPAPLHLSNLQLICPKCAKPTRIAFEIEEVKQGDSIKHKKIRICKKCKKTID
jgi:large subunit ribosomal protein L24